MRRGRVIQGSVDEAYRPFQIFGFPNDFTYQRIFGELKFEGLSVSHTKDGFQWEEHEEAFLRKLKEIMEKEPLPIISQADKYRKRAAKKDYESAAETTLNRNESVFKNALPKILNVAEKKRSIVLVKKSYLKPGVQSIDDLK